MGNKKLKILKHARRYKMHLKDSDSENIYSDISLCKIEALFNREIILEGCNKVTEYNEARISFKVANGSVIIDGEHLNIYSFEEETAVIRGKIFSISFEN